MHMVRTEPIFKNNYRMERKKVSSQFYRFGHGDVPKIRKTCAIQALHTILVSAQLACGPKTLGSLFKICQ